MPFVKVVKNRAYFRRFQVKFRRRREAKTDYYARQRLIIQDKNKYKTPKYRFVVRITTRDVICQIFSSDLNHDVCMAAAYSHELPRYGAKLGLTNYASAYATGLLLARRVNAKLKLNYEGNLDVNGEEYHVEASGDGPAPFRAFLDVGLRRTTTGSRIFGALKGAVDGGLDIPHNTRRFAGASKGEEGWELDAGKLRHYIFGGPVADYMRALQESDEDQFNKQFSRYIAAGISADDLEGIYTKVHAAIRAEPNKARSALELGAFKTRTTPKSTAEVVPKKYNKARRSLADRRNRIVQKLLALNKIPKAP